MSSIFTKRLTKELRDLRTNPPANIHVETADDNLKIWRVTIKGAEGTLYEGEVFTLQFTFTPAYPLDSPEVIFIDHIPVHPHVYSNGHICLSILYDQWSPALTIQSVCLSILSMLSSCTKKERPPDNNMYVMTAKKSPKQTTWAFHDEETVGKARLVDENTSEERKNEGRRGELQREGHDDEIGKGERKRR
ncbi:ubiquitin-conjugating enzyme/RWD-like protein [Gaertneriomyces semiglobifer]|nr:ubiquitin-conjugating enzyme/RWD-like protein [Gaertneriomyces semiglobifer]